MSRRFQRLLVSSVAMGSALIPIQGHAASPATISPLASVGRSTSVVRADWPMFRSDPQRDGVNHYENVLNRRNVNRLALAWSQPIGLGNTFADRPAPVVSNGFVYAGSADGLSAFDADTGAVRWRRKLSINSSPAVVEAAAEGVLYVGGSHLARYGVTAYAAGTGTALWTFYTGFTVPASPVVVEGVVYVRSVDGYMYALDAATGHRIWAR